MTTKYIFVTGGVVSSVGKGVTAAAIGLILKERGYKVAVQKLDPYINVDPGTMSPYHHGEVYVLDDGAETDLDLGHYERFLDVNLSHMSNATSGSVYSKIIEKERRGDFLGATVQVIPHLTKEIKDRIVQLEEQTKPDVIIAEIGGTIGDIEGLPFLEAIREFQIEHPRGDVLFSHLTYLPHLSSTDELKTKPTQHSVAELRRVGIRPDIIACRSDIPVSQEIREKISLFCDVPKNHVFSVQDVSNIYEVPLRLEEEGVCDALMELWGLEKKKSNLEEWEKMVNIMNNLSKVVHIALVGKYISLRDSYISFIEALKHAQNPNMAKVQLHWINSEDIENKSAEEVLKGMDGILVPGGFGKRGIEGMILAAKYARENKIPYFGVCLGLQIAVLDYARHVLGLTHSNSTEFDQGTPYPVIDLMPEQRTVKDKGATMRLGGINVKIQPHTLAHTIYQTEEIRQRHRHRYEFNNAYKTRFENAKMVFSGINMEKNLVEILELPSHPFYVGCQFHPELISRPTRPEPLFTHFIKAAVEYSEHR